MMVRSILRDLVGGTRHVDIGESVHEFLLDIAIRVELIL
jgi:hypothetical protein